MTEIIHGLVSGLIWAAILGSFLIAIAAVITATASASGRVSAFAGRGTPPRTREPHAHEFRSGSRTWGSAMRPRVAPYEAVRALPVK
jgi:hypothetical protein